jgi:hypothetical protein
VNELEFPAWPEHPGLGEWIPAELLADVIAELPGLTGTDGWLRAVPDPRQPFPAVHLQVVWLADGHIHLVTVSGCTVAAVPPGRATPQLDCYRHISLEQLVAGSADWSSDTWPPAAPR